MKLLLAVNGLIFALFLTPAMAQTTAAPAIATPPPSTAVGAAAPAAPHPMIFHPPGGVSGGILPIRVGGGSRGIKGGDNFTLEVLVPEQMALTTQAQPSLYWYQSSAAKTQCEVTVT